MNTPYRQSPVNFDRSVRSETLHDGWNVVLAFEDEGSGPWLVDLSHLSRWDYQHAALESCTPLGLEVPAQPGQVTLQGGLLISRMNRTQAAVCCLSRNAAPARGKETHVTELTDAHCMLAVLGQSTPRVMEHVSNLDLFRPGRPAPCLTQGPVMHIPCQVITMDVDCILMTFSRGYGQTFAEAMLRAASGCGLRPGGEDVFNRWLSRR